MVVYILEFSHIINTSKQPVPQAPYKKFVITSFLSYLAEAVYTTYLF
jgi:hypothetical protein